jgi:hypothetical protein
MVLDALRWHRHGSGEDLRSDLPPEQVQPSATAFERAVAGGVSVRVVQAAAHAASGLTRAAFRGGEVVGVHALGDLVEQAVRAFALPGKVFCYAYHADLDFLGHVYGPGSGAWRRQLRVVDVLAAALAEELPPGGRLVVTADHGMVAARERIDVDVEAGLLEGVALLAGEPRVRHVHTVPGAAADVQAAWAERVGAGAWVARREEALAAGWFGPRVAPSVLGRIGDVVVAARGDLVVVRSREEAVMSALVGQHGSLTAAEQWVPLLQVHR